MSERKKEKDSLAYEPESSPRAFSRVPLAVSGRLEMELRPAQDCVSILLLRAFHSAIKCQSSKYFWISIDYVYAVAHEAI